jgi:ubiquinone/menaquinone biosynthesis C-methylase UbiE
VGDALTAAMGFYERHLLARIIDFACGQRAIRAQRQLVLPRARGAVLEIGMGSGHNLPLYDPRKVDVVWGLEPAEGMRRLAQARVAQVPFEVRFLDLPGERIPLEDASVDTVVTTYTLCTIPDAAAALAQMRRVLRPGGELIFLEHGEAPDDDVRRWQRRIEPAWKRVFGGCHLTRPIARLIEGAGFRMDELQAAYVSGLYLPGLTVSKIGAFEYWGAARRAA